MSICSRGTTNMNGLDKALTSSKYDYPSITPYHALGTRGGATDRVLAEFEPGETILWTRKLDGSNTKILLHNDIDDLFDFLIGTREGWLYADGDRIWRKDHGILDALFPDGWQPGWDAMVEEALDLVKTSKLFGGEPDEECIVIYGETYGGKNDMRKSAAYGNRTLFTAFDVVLHAGDKSEWFLPKTGVDVVHSEVFTPRTPDEMRAMMRRLEAHTGRGQGADYLEGYVLRSESRPGVKAKVRFETYNKTTSNGASA